MLKQKGASLVEFMIASSLGLISLAIVGSLYISGQKAAMERSKELMLLQNTASVLQMLRNDIQRAGFDGIDGNSVKISGASNTIYTLDAPGMGLLLTPTMSGLPERRLCIKTLYMNNASIHQNLCLYVKKNKQRSGV